MCDGVPFSRVPLVAADKGQQFGAVGAFVRKHRLGRRIVPAIVRVQLVIRPSLLVEPRHGLGDVGRADLAAFLAIAPVGFRRLDQRFGCDAFPDPSGKLVPCGLLGVGAIPSRVGFPEPVESIRIAPWGAMGGFFLI